MAYTDRSGAEGSRGSGVYYEDTCDSRTKTYSAYLGPTASEADAEQMALVCALEWEHQEQPLALASYSLAALTTLCNLAYRAPCRSHIEVRLKEALQEKREVGTLWVRGHVAIASNEEVDCLEGSTASLGAGRGDEEISTFEGMKETGRK